MATKSADLLSLDEEVIFTRKLPQPLQPEVLPVKYSPVSTTSREADFGFCEPLQQDDKPVIKKDDSEQCDIKTPRSVADSTTFGMQVPDNSTAILLKQLSLQNEVLTKLVARNVKTDHDKFNSLLPKPEKFVKGNFLYWLSTFENYACHLKLPRFQWKELLKGYLSIECQHAVMRMHRPESESYDVFRQSLLEEFTNQLSPLEAEYKLGKRTQRKGETAREFARALQDFARRAYPDEDLFMNGQRDKRVIACFIDGLIDRSSAKMLYRLYSKDHSLTLENMIREVEILESSDGMFAKTSRVCALDNDSKSDDGIREALDRLTSELTVMKSEIQSLKEKPMPEAERSANVEWGGNRRRSVKCYACGNFGHIARNCMFKNTTPKTTHLNDRGDSPREEPRNPQNLQQ